LKTALLLSLLLPPAFLHALGTLGDYERAASLRHRVQGLTLNFPEPVNWIGNTSRFWSKAKPAQSRL
jgi:hypothetical protein